MKLTATGVEKPKQFPEDEIYTTYNHSREGMHQTESGHLIKSSVDVGVNAASTESNTNCVGESKSYFQAASSCLHSNTGISGIQDYRISGIQDSRIQDYRISNNS